MKDFTLWFGTEESLNTALQAEAYGLQHPDRAAATLALYAQEDDEQDEEDTESRLLQIEGNVALMRVSGAMSNKDSWMNRLFGVTSYPEIVAAVQEATDLDGVDTLLMELDTPGGSASGLETVTEALNWAKEQGMTVQTHTSGAMLSAGYWIGVSGGEITATKMADIGSIGVVMVHQSVYEALKESGVEYTVIRSGKYKALGHPTEKLTDEAKEIMQTKADQMYGFFLDHIVTNRPQLSFGTSESWAEGLTFFGEEAKMVGLVDRVTTLSNRVESLEIIDNQSNHANNTGTFTQEVGTMGKKQTVLRSNQDKAALAAGADVTEVETVQVDATVTGTEGTAPEPKAEGAAPGAEGEAGEISPEANAEGDEAKVITLESTTTSELSDYLKEQNATLSDEKAALTQSLSNAEAELSALKADQSSLLKIAVEATHRMQVATGFSPVDLEGLPASTVAAQYDTAKTTFEAKYTVGQQSKPFALEDDNTDGPHAAELGIIPKS